MRSWDVTTLIEDFLKDSGFRGVQGLAAHNVRASFKYRTSAPLTVRSMNAGTFKARRL